MDGWVPFEGNLRGLGSIRVSRMVDMNWGSSFGSDERRDWHICLRKTSCLLDVETALPLNALY